MLSLEQSNKALKFAKTKNSGDELSSVMEQSSFKVQERIIQESQNYKM